MSVFSKLLFLYQINTLDTRQTYTVDIQQTQQHIPYLHVDGTACDFEFPKKHHQFFIAE